MLSACKQYPPTDLTTESIIPKPVSVEATTRTFELSKTTQIVVDGSNEELMFVG
jgi:hypothetical protein